MRCVLSLFAALNRTDMFYELDSFLQSNDKYPSISKLLTENNDKLGEISQVKIHSIARRTNNHHEDLYFMGDTTNDFLLSPWASALASGSFRVVEVFMEKNKMARDIAEERINKSGLFPELQRKMIETLNATGNKL